MYTRVNNDADVCVECMVQTAMKYSPHLEWVVAHIGSVKVCWQRVIKWLINGAVVELITYLLHVGLILLLGQWPSTAACNFLCSCTKVSSPLQVWPICRLSASRFLLQVFLHLLIFLIPLWGSRTRLGGFCRMCSIHIHLLLISSLAGSCVDFCSISVLLRCCWWLQTSIQILKSFLRQNLNFSNCCLCCSLGFRTSHYDCFYIL